MNDLQSTTKAYTHIQKLVDLELNIFAFCLLKVIFCKAAWITKYDVKLLETINSISNKRCW